MDVSKLKTAIIRSGWNGTWEDQIEGLLSKLNFLEQTGRYGRLLANLLGANDRNNFEALVLEATIAYQFECAGLSLQYEVQQVADDKSSVDLCWRTATGTEVFIEVRLLQQDKATVDSISMQLDAHNTYAVLKSGEEESQEIIRLQQVILEKVQKRDGTPTKFLTMPPTAINLVAVDISSIILGAFDFDDCKLVTEGDPSVPEINRRGIFGLFQEAKLEYPSHIQSLAQLFVHVRNTLHGVLFLFRKPKTEHFDYSVERFLGWNSALVEEETAREVCEELNKALPLLRK